jgi:hypothetical protein
MKKLKTGTKYSFQAMADYVAAIDDFNDSTSSRLHVNPVYDKVRQRDK